MVHTGLHKKLKTGICPECAATATKPRKYYGKPRWRKICIWEVLRKMQEHAKYLSTFVEMGVVRIIATIKQKLEDRGNTCIFLGYAKIHIGGT